MAKCNCDLCKRGRKFDRIIEKFKDAMYFGHFLTKEKAENHKDIKWLKQLYSHLIEIESELDMIRNKDGFFVHIDPSDWKGIIGTAEKE